MEFAELLDAAGESESESEAAPAWSGRGARPVRPPSGRSSFQPRLAPSAAPQYVTQMQLEAALTRSDSKIKTVADGISTITARLATLASAGKKEVDERKKTVDTQNKDLNQKLQLLALLPVLVKPPSVDGAVVDLTPTAATRSYSKVLDSAGNPLPIVTRDSNSLNMLLPLLLVTGMGSAGGLSAGDSGGDSGMSMMMLAMVLAMSGNK
jgi:hypothetical protein